MRKKCYVGINFMNVIEFVEEVNQELDYISHLTTRMLNMIGATIYYLDLYHEEDIDPENEYVFYIDTKYSKNGFMQAACFRGNKKSVKHITRILPDSFVNQMILAFGEENFWSMLEGAGYKIIYTMPRESTYRAINEMIEKIQQNLDQIEEQNIDQQTGEQASDEKNENETN